MPLWRKYRAKTFADVYGYKKIIADLRAYVAQGDMPNLLFEGPPGRGKTMIAEVLRNEFSLDRRNYKELNTSDDRGVATIRGAVKNFAQTARVGVAPFKIMLLDEADGMTKPAMRALKRTMELYPHIRFILTCNDRSKVIKPLRDRCTEYKFRAIHYTHMERLIADVARKEGKPLSKSVVTAIRQVAAGSPRKAMNILESVLVDPNMSPEEIHKLLGVPKEENLFHLIGSMLKGDIKALKIMRQLLDEGGDATKTIRALYGIAMRGGPRLSDDDRKTMLRAIGYLPGATDEQRLAAIVVDVIDRRSRG